ncbi:MAG: universal stress protein [Planctomycetaceae bacterium]|nr:universal stress protein [Planctomycetaceae bacterium]
MIAIKKVLFPTDLSDAAAEAQLYACALADQFDAELHVLSVLQDVSLMSPDPNMPWVIPASSLEEVRTSLEAALAKVPDPTWAAGKSVQRVIRIGAPYVEIVKYAAEQDVDIIVVGTHGRSGLTHLLLGSTAEKVVRKAPCPVLTVHPKGHQFVT